MFGPNAMASVGLCAALAVALFNMHKALDDHEYIGELHT